MKKKKVLLVGCGQLGSRHLQALACLKEVAEIHVIDPNPGSLELGQSRVADVADRNQDIKYHWHNEPNAACWGGDLCILPTQARGRAGLIKSVANGLGYQQFFIEKIVTQSVGEYEDLLNYSEQKGLKIWINCQTRTYNIHKLIKSRLDPDEPILFANYGGNQGLACNGIHYADLFLFYDGSDELVGAGSRIDEVLHPSKRGNDIFDLSGTLHGYSKKGSDCVISYSGANLNPDYVSIVTPGCKYIVDHINLVAFASEARSDWAWERINIEEKYAVSHMSKRFVSDILNKSKCELPSLGEGLASHKYILGQLLPHFNRLLGANNDHCPVT